MTIAEVNMLARLSGMSYGAYVFLMGQKLNRESSEYILRKGEVRCACCNRAFTPRNGRMKYCTPECRKAKQRLNEVTSRKAG